MVIKDQVKKNRLYKMTLGERLAVKSFGKIVTQFLVTFFQARRLYAALKIFLK